MSSPGEIKSNTILLKFVVLVLISVKHNKSRRGRPPRHLVYQRLEDAIVDLRERMGGLPSPTEAEGIWTSIWYQEAHHSTALEGNTLVIAQVEALLAEGRAVGNKELREYMEVTGYADAAKWVYGQALEPGDWTSQAPLMMTEVRHVHELALGPVWGVSPHPNAAPEEKPGSFRRHDIQPFPSGMVPPPWVEVPAAMVDWVDSLATIAASDNPVEAIAGSPRQLRENPSVSRRQWPHRQAPPEPAPDPPRLPPRRHLHPRPQSAISAPWREPTTAILGLSGSSSPGR